MVVRYALSGEIDIMQEEVIITSDRIINDSRFLSTVFTIKSRIKYSLQLQRSQKDLLDQLDLGGWNCFGEYRD
jgi:hypothetical protein